MPSVVAKFHSCEGAIELFSRGGQPACELLASNPLAGFCLALTHIFKSATCAPLATANDLVQKPQREILAWCGFKPATEAIAKIGRKVAPESLTSERSLQLRRILVDGETREMLAHLKKINAGVIDLVSSIQLRKAITPQLLNAVADSDEELSDSETAPLLKDAVTSAHQAKQSHRRRFWGGNDQVSKSPRFAQLKNFKRTVANREIAVALMRTGSSAAQCGFIVLRFRGKFARYH